MAYNKSWRESKRSAGIYRIVCLATGKRYIGSSIHLYRRLHRHLDDLRAGIHGNRYLQRAFNKYGREQFIVETLFYCNPEDCERFERNLIESIPTKECYNLKSASDGHFVMSEETKQMLRDKVAERYKSDEYRKKMSDCHKGQIVTEEQRKKISAALKGRKPTEEARANYKKAWETRDRTVSPEVRAKISKTLTGRKNPHAGYKGPRNKHFDISAEKEAYNA
jgi:group I intron endonuclease